MKNYEQPKVEIIEIEIENAVLSSSIEGSEIKPEIVVKSRSIYD